MEAYGDRSRTIYALRCPETNRVHYIGLTRRPKSRRAMHRSKKKHAKTPVDKWSHEWAMAGHPVKWQTIVKIRGDFAHLAVAIEELIIAKLKDAGHDLLNADLDAIRRRKRPPVTINQELVAKLLGQNT